MSAKPIVAATDGSEESLRAVDWAAREAVLRGTCTADRVRSAGTRERRAENRPIGRFSSRSPAGRRRPPDADAGSVIWRANPCAIGRRQVTVTECNQQAVTNWLRAGCLPFRASG